MEFYLNQLAPCVDRFVFRSLLNPKVNDALVIHNPMHVICESPVLMRSSKSLEDHISYIQKQQIDKAIIVAEDIEFIRLCSSLKYLWVIPALSAKKIDYSPLYSLPYLQWLRCDMSNGDHAESQLDCGLIDNLGCLSINGWNANINLSRANKLKTLYLSCGHPIDRSLNVLQPECTLQNVVVENSNITSLSGIKNAKNLKRLELLHNRKLQNIDELLDVKNSLVWLDIGNCSAITDYSVLSELHNLELLRLSGRKSIPTLDFVKDMPNLKCLVIMLDVLDGDLSGCTNIPYVAIKNRKHFSHSDKDFTKIIPFPLSITAYE